MEHAFVIVVAAVAAVGVLGALLALLASARPWDSFGRDHLLMESDLRDPRRRDRAAAGAAARDGAPLPAGAAGAEREQEIRQMLEASNRRRRRRGEPERDVDSELARLLDPGPDAPPPGAPPARAALDAELVAEIRQLVIARNHRRVRRGEDPLDVEAEIARQIARLNG